MCCFLVFYPNPNKKLYFLSKMTSLILHFHDGRYIHIYNGFYEKLISTCSSNICLTRFAKSTVFT